VTAAAGGGAVKENGIRRNGAIIENGETGIEAMSLGVKAAINVVWRQSVISEAVASKKAPKIEMASGENNGKRQLSQPKNIGEMAKIISVAQLSGVGVSKYQWRKSYEKRNYEKKKEISGNEISMYRAGEK